MSPPDRPPGPTPTERMTLRALFVLVSMALVWILLPLYGAILWGGIIGLLFMPIYHRLLLPLKGRRTPAALLTLLLAVLIVIVPFTLVTATLAREAMGVYERVQSDEWNVTNALRSAFDAMPAPLATLLERIGLADFAAVQRRLAVAAAQASEFVANRALGVTQDTFHFVASLFITTYLAFFLIRDGDHILGRIRQSIPLDPQSKAELLGKFATVLRATVKGNLVVATIQGALGGVAFWVLGIEAAVLCGVLMAFLSLLPAVGAALVWGPVVVYLWLTGSIWQAVALAAYGVLVIGLVDNVLRPVLVGRDTRMPDYVVMLTTLGGMATFGIHGFVLGPTIAAMFIAVAHLYGLSLRPRSGEPPA
jgi:predicted PurR-regulated permease PerM